MGLFVGATAGGGRMIRIDDPYARGWLEVNGDGAYIAHEIDTTYVRQSERKPAKLADRVGAAIARKVPRLHALYVGLASAVVDRLDLAGPGLAKAVTLCGRSGPDGKVCEKLQRVDGQPFCAACGCPHKVKRAAGLLAACPLGYWTLSDGVVRR